MNEEREWLEKEYKKAEKKYNSTYSSVARSHATHIMAIIERCLHGLDLLDEKEQAEAEERERKRIKSGYYDN